MFSQLYFLYLCPTNFAAVARRLYVEASTSNTIVRFALSRQVQETARTELLRQAPVVDVHALYREADAAFNALSELLGDHPYFFASKVGSLFDAAVFSYTNILLDDKIQWKERRMIEDLNKYKNLVRHRNMISQKYFRTKDTYSKD